MYRAVSVDSATFSDRIGHDAPRTALTDIPDILTVLCVRERGAHARAAPHGARSTREAEVGKPAGRVRRGRKPERAAPAVPLRPSQIADAIRISDAARLLGVSARTIHRMIAGGFLVPFYLPHSGRPRIPLNQINEIRRQTDRRQAPRQKPSLANLVRGDDAAAGAAPA